MFGITLVEYNNFEAGEGKSKLDTHFAHISHKIVRWVRVGNNLETGSQLGELIGVCTRLLVDGNMTLFNRCCQFCCILSWKKFSNLFLAFV